jgi:hypothetical protein
VKRYLKTDLSDMPISSELAAVAKRVVGFDLGITYEVKVMEWSETPSLILVPRIHPSAVLLKSRDPKPQFLTREEAFSVQELYHDRLPLITQAQLEELGIKVP